MSAEQGASLQRLKRRVMGNQQIRYLAEKPLYPIYNAQKGKCAVTGKDFQTAKDHITPRNKGGTDEYENLILVTETVHKLIHETRPETIAKLLKDCEPNLEKLNELRKQAGNEI